MWNSSRRTVIDTADQKAQTVNTFRRYSTLLQARSTFTPRPRSTFSVIVSNDCGTLV